MIVKGGSQKVLATEIKTKTNDDLTFNLEEVPLLTANLPSLEHKGTIQFADDTVCL